MTRRGAIGIVVACLMHGAALAQSAEPYVEKSTGFVFPAQIGKFHREEVVEYPDKRLGIKIRYEGRGRAEVFVYDFGFTEISTGIDSAAVKKAFADSKVGMERLLTHPPASNPAKALDASPVVNIEGGEHAKLLAALYTWTFTGSDGRSGPMASCILVTGAKNKIVKLLFTAPSPDATSSQADLKEFVLAFLEANPKERGAFILEEKKAN
ncbi:MAG TPA: hypothetical protein VKR38_15565 [Usitatibacter sp.]|nr:hypothetical protein [Usitatibacter sp.]